jgi:hypothetical protein
VKIADEMHFFFFFKRYFLINSLAECSSYGLSSGANTRNDMNLASVSCICLIAILLFAICVASVCLFCTAAEIAIGPRIHRALGV